MQIVDVLYAWFWSRIFSHKTDWFDIYNTINIKSLVVVCRKNYAVVFHFSYSFMLILLVVIM